MEPLISIIVPIFNVMDYLPRCVDSLRKQTYRKLEILLVDDGSTDGTAALCDRLAQEDRRIRVFHKQNGGTSSARNLGIRNARGAYLGFVDSDDYVSADMYEKLVAAVLKYGTKAAQIGRDELDEQGQALPDICIPPQEIGLIPPRDFLRELLMHRGDCSFCTKLIARECFEGMGFPEGVLNEDFRLLVEMLPRIGILTSLPGHAYHVCYRLGSNTRKEGAEVFSRVYGDNVENADMVLALVKQGYPDSGIFAFREQDGFQGYQHDMGEKTGAWNGNGKTGANAVGSGTTNRDNRQVSDLVTVAIRFGIYQRLDYLLHIPISQMKKENFQYCQIVSWLRWNLWKGLWNPYLTLKNKLYQLLFSIAPKGIRVIHSRLRHKTR